MAQSDAATNLANLSEDLWSTFIPDSTWQSRTGRGVSVAIVDSGIDSQHPALLGKVSESVEAVAEGSNIVFQPSTSGDQAGHGTACAGIVASIAPDADFHSVKVLGPNASGSGTMFLAGLEYAIKHKMRVINLSLGTTKSEFFAPMHDLMDRAYHAGCIVVAAANNLPYPSYPSIFSSSIVAVIKRAGGDPFDIGFRYGQVIEVVAPGVEVEAAWPGGGTRRLTGNSFAAPYVTGIIALLLEAYPDLTPFQVKSALYAIARRNQARRALTEQQLKSDTPPLAI
ncbi:MAG: S8 family serine peptidase [Pyrinomonadaceae bacterium]